jgi:chemotaxis protein MotB
MSTRRSRRRILAGIPITHLLLVLLLLPVLSGCVARSAWNDLQTEHRALLDEREQLRTEVRRLSLERDSLEAQYLEATESLEDERIVRSTLATNLERLSEKAESLDESLDAERLAHLEAAAALAAREAEIAAMQSTYDELVGDLESEVSAGQIEIERLREGLRLNVSDDVLFASGSAELDSTGRAVLRKVAGQLSNLADFVEVRGHTDDRPIRGALAQRFPSNWELAAARAARVVRLLEEEGVPGERLAVVSLGPNEPIAPNDTPQSRARNRRIEIRLIPRESARAAAVEASPERPREAKAGPGADDVAAPSPAAAGDARPAPGEATPSG